MRHLLRKHVLNNNFQVKSNKQPSWKAGFDPEKATLFWTPKKSVFYSPKHGWRDLWDLERQEAAAICTLKGAVFKDVSGE